MERWERYHLPFLFVFSLILYLSFLGSRDLWAPVEPRYGEIARVMFAKGEWIVMVAYYLGKDFFNRQVGLVAALVLATTGLCLREKPEGRIGPWSDSGAPYRNRKGKRPYRRMKCATER